MKTVTNIREEIIVSLPHFDLLHMLLTKCSQ
jgi:hypothetical protein